MKQSSFYVGNYQTISFHDLLALRQSYSPKSGKLGSVLSQNSLRTYYACSVEPDPEKRDRMLIARDLRGSRGKDYGRIRNC